MPTPNQMPKKPSKLRQQIVAGLIATKPSSWDRKSISKDEDGKEIVTTRRQRHDALKFPFAQNMSDDAVDRLSERWL